MPLFVVQLLSCIQLFGTPWTAACQVSLSFTISQSLLKLMSIKLVMPSDHPIFCHLLLLPLAFPSIRDFFPKCWLFISGDQNSGTSTSASVLPMNIQGWFPLGVTALISLLSKKAPQESSLAPQLEGINSSVLSILKSRDITLSTKTHIVKAMVCWAIKKAEHRRMDAS